LKIARPVKGKFNSSRELTDVVGQLLIDHKVVGERKTMKALVWHNKHTVSVDEVPDPTIEDPRDAIVKITSTAICGSDLHLYDGLIHPMPPGGQTLGHEPMGEVVEVGSGVTRLKAGDRVVIPFTISCGECFFCKEQLYSCCDTTNRTPELAEKLYGYAPAGLFGYSQLTGGYPGGQPSGGGYGTTGQQSGPPTPPTGFPTYGQPQATQSAPAGQSTGQAQPQSSSSSSTSNQSRQ